jgi:hypothetical protein
MSLRPELTLHEEVDAGAVDRFGTRRRIGAALFVSLLIVVPCVWQRHIQSSDLPSHLYNAWLVNLIREKPLPGLYLVPQYTNVLFDWLLEVTMRFGGADIAERVCSSIAVLCFFWGTLSFVWTVNTRATMAAGLWVALLAYGAVFRLGFMNFYISIGLTLAAASLVLRRRSGWIWCSLPLVAVAVLAHPLPVVWGAGVVCWVMLHERLRKPWLLLVSGVAAVLSIAAATAPSVGAGWPFAVTAGVLPALLGADQVLVFGPKYFLVAVGLVALLGFRMLQMSEMSNGIALLRDWRFQLLLAHALAVILFPPAIDTAGRPFTYIPQRLSLLTGIAALLFYFAVRFSNTEKVFVAALAALFFSFSFFDERALNGFEGKVARLARQLPRGQRVVAGFREPISRTPVLIHALDRACMAHCYSFGNYEPASQHFRVRAAGPNAYVLASGDQVWALENGQYRVAQSDLPLHVLVPCGDSNSLCVERPLAGELIPLQTVRVLPDLW